jgi:hypothetical protein
MYNMLRRAGFPKAQIFVYYAGGSSPIDCDNEDGDNNDATGSDLTGGAIKTDIRSRIQNLCTSLDNKNSILLTYFTNHGADNAGACLWDVTSNGLGADEIYTPAELSADVANCKVLKHFMIHDQCYSGEFLPMASDRNHKNLAVYVAASDSEVSWGREYMARWELNDILTSTVNQMHQDVVANGNLRSIPGMAEGTTGKGNHKLSAACALRIPWWKKYWYLIFIFILVPVIYVLRPKLTK